MPGYGKTAGLVLVAAFSSCTWPQDNPIDPKRCVPACAMDKVCFNGACVDPDAGFTEARPDKQVPPDVGQPDRPLDDIIKPDTGVPDLAIPDIGDLGPDICTPCKTNTTCDDGDPCTVNFCGPGGCCMSAPAKSGISCDDKSDCTDNDQCNGKGQCFGTNKKVGTQCSDGDPYTKMDRCDGKGKCTPLAWSPSKTCPGFVSKDGWCFHYPLPQGNWLHGIWGSSTTDLYVVGVAGTILHYNGNLWRKQDSGTNHNMLRGIWGSSSTDIYAVGSGMTIMHSNGSTWMVQKTGTPYIFQSIWGSSGTDVFAVGSDLHGTDVLIYHYDGLNWKSQLSGATLSKFLGSVWGTSSTDVYAVGEFVLHYDGKFWKKKSTLGVQYFDNVWAANSTDVYVLANDKLLHNEGKGWNIVDIGATRPKCSIWGSDSSNVFVLTNPPKGSFFHYNGSSWSKQASGKRLQKIWGLNSTCVYGTNLCGPRSPFCEPSVPRCPAAPHLRCGPPAHPAPG